MRRFYLSLGMRQQTLERTIELAKVPPKIVESAAKPRNRAKRSKSS